MAHSRTSWDALVQMEDVDLALVQEACRVPEDLRSSVDVDQRLWDHHRLWPGRQNAALGYPSVVARLSDRVSASFIETKPPLGDPFGNEFYSSEWGTLGAATVKSDGNDESLIVISMAPWSNAYTRESGSPSRRESIGSVHQLISDLSRLVGRQSRVIAAGDLVIYPGWSTYPTAIWNEREALHFQTAFDRMRALGFRHDRARRAAQRPWRCGDLPQHRRDARGGLGASRLRLRHRKHRRPRIRPRSQRSRRLGPKRPLSHRHRPRIGSS